MGEIPEKWEEVKADVAKPDLAIWHDQTTRRLSGFQLGYIIYIYSGLTSTKVDTEIDARKLNEFENHKLNIVKI